MQLWSMLHGNAFMSIASNRGQRQGVDKSDHWQQHKAKIILEPKAHNGKKHGSNKYLLTNQTHRPDKDQPAPDAATRTSQTLKSILFPTIPGPVVSSTPRTLLHPTWLPLNPARASYHIIQLAHRSTSLDFSPLPRHRLLASPKCFAVRISLSDCCIFANSTVSF